MKAIYKGCSFRASRFQGKIRIGSDKKSEGFVEYVDVLGNRHEDHFVRLLDETELDYLYEERFEIQYQGHFFKISSALRRINLDRDWFEIYVSLEEHQLGISLGFERTDKFLWSKEIGRKDIEAFKIIEMPQGPFSNQGIKVRILEGQEIDDYFASITD